MKKTTRLLSLCVLSYTVQQKAHIERATQTYTELHIWFAQMANDKCFNTYFGLPKSLFCSIPAVCFAYLHLAENIEPLRNGEEPKNGGHKAKKKRNEKRKKKM